MFYSDVEPLHQEVHAALSVEVGSDYGFCRDTNSVLLTVPEFAVAAREYGIVFADTGEAAPGTRPLPLAVLGVKPGQNLFVDTGAAWTGRYVPAFVRRYPFVFAMTPGEEALSLCIDRSYPGVNSDGRGEPLFDAKGAYSPYLERILGFMDQFQQAHRHTEEFCQRLARLELLEAQQAEVRLADGSVVRLDGFSAVSRERFAKLPDSELADLFRSGYLELIYLHLQSLGNLEFLAERLERAGAG